MKSTRQTYQAPYIRLVTIDLTDSVLQNIDSQPTHSEGELGDPPQPHNTGRKQSIWHD